MSGGMNQYSYITRSPLTLLKNIHATGSLDDCWFWHGKNKYGNVRLYGRQLKAHRLVLSVVLGFDIPPHLEVCHSCDSPGCCNPGHLFLGTHADNMHDRDRKGRGRSPPGEGNGISKLTSQSVMDIVTLRSSRMSMRRIAKMFNVSAGCIGDIFRGKTWSHVTGIRMQ